MFKIQGVLISFVVTTCVLSSLITVIFAKKKGKNTKCLRVLTSIATASAFIARKEISMQLQRHSGTGHQIKRCKRELSFPQAG